MSSPDLPVCALVVEDEARYRDFLADVLREMACRPLLASCAVDALRLIEADSPDMVLLDLNLPITDGIAFLEQLRRTRPQAPVVIITGYGDLDSARRAIHLGVSDFLLKPCELGQLEAAIDRARRRIPGRGPDSWARSTERPAGLSAAPATRPLSDIEREAIVRALRENRGNRSAAARALGISRRALYNKLATYRSQGHEVP